MDFNHIQQEVDFKAVRSRGPGGQNVNKVSSAAWMTWNPLLSFGLTEVEKNYAIPRLANWLNSEGVLFLRSDEYRDLERNKARCLEKLNAILQGALHKPKPRKATKPTRSSKVKRRESKTKRGETKKNRRRVDY